MTAGEIAALIFGAIGAMTGIAALVQNRIQARQSDAIQDRLAVVEEARRRDELRPDLTMSWSGTTVGRANITIRNGDRTDIDHVEIADVIEAPPALDRGIKSVVGPYHSLRMGEALTIVPDTDPKPGGPLVLRVRVRAGAASWEVALSCEIPDHSPTRISKAKFSR